jgi:hypothetical protein
MSHEPIEFSSQHRSLVVTIFAIVSATLAGLVLSAPPPKPLPEPPFRVTGTVTHEEQTGSGPISQRFGFEYIDMDSTRMFRLSWGESTSLAWRMSEGSDIVYKGTPDSPAGFYLMPPYFADLLVDLTPFSSHSSYRNNLERPDPRVQLAVQQSGDTLSPVKVTSLVDYPSGQSNLLQYVFVNGAMSARELYIQMPGSPEATLHSRVSFRGFDLSVPGLPRVQEVLASYDEDGVPRKRIVFEADFASGLPGDTTPDEQWEKLTRGLGHLQYGDYRIEDPKWRRESAMLVHGKVDSDAAVASGQGSSSGGLNRWWLIGGAVAGLIGVSLLLRKRAG